jgi:2'-5' RNA ligase
MVRALERRLAQPPVEFASWRAGEVHLMRSELRREGARYTSLYTCRLGTQPEDG